MLCHAYIFTVMFINIKWNSETTWEYYFVGVFLYVWAILFHLLVLFGAKWVNKLFQIVSKMLPICILERV